MFVGIVYILYLVCNDEMKSQSTIYQQAIWPGVGVVFCWRFYLAYIFICCIQKWNGIVLDTRHEETELILLSLFCIIIFLFFFFFSSSLLLLLFIQKC